MKKTAIALLLCMILCLSLCTGCVIRDPSYNDLDTLIFYANFKADSDADYGEKCALYQGRIYYQSAEQVEQGVYSMRLDGSDVRLEFEAEDIRALAVKSDGFYYSGFSDIGTNDNGAFRRFCLYKRDSAQSEPVDLLSQASGHENLKNDNVWDFYIAENGILYYRTTAVDFFYGRLNLWIGALSDKMLLSVPDYQFLLEDLHAFSGTSLRPELVLYEKDGQYIIVAKSSQDSETVVQLTTWFDVSLFDSSVGRTVLPIDVVFMMPYGQIYDTTNDRWILRLSDSSMLIAAEGALLRYDRTTGEGREICSFPTSDRMYATYDTGTDILLLTKTFRSMKWFPRNFRRLFHLPTQKSETLYRADPDNGERMTLLGIGQDEAFLYVDSSIAATASGKTISVYDIGTDSPVLVRTVELEHEIVDDANKVDSAAGWLFLYRFNDETQRDELLEKVYIG